MNAWKSLAFVVGAGTVIFSVVVRSLFKQSNHWSKSAQSYFIGGMLLAVPVTQRILVAIATGEPSSLPAISVIGDIVFPAAGATVIGYALTRRRHSEPNERNFFH